MNYNTIKPILTSKTFWASVVTVVTGTGMYCTGEQNLQELLIAIIGAVFGYLRTVTDKGVYIK